MNLRQLRTLSTILDRGSFAAAADHIGLSHAAVSVQMNQLETTLSAELFDRSSRPVKLTADGVRIAQLAGEVLDAERLRAADGGEPERLRVRERLRAAAVDRDHVRDLERLTHCREHRGRGAAGGARCTSGRLVRGAAARRPVAAAIDALGRAVGRGRASLSTDLEARHSTPFRGHRAN